MLQKRIRLTALALICAGVMSVQAGEMESAIQKKMNEFAGSEVVQAVTATSYGGLYEVVMNNGQLLYTDKEFSFFLDGRLIDVGQRLDVTADRMSKLSAIDLKTLPLGNAIKRVSGKGERVLVSFEDPNCGYCKRFAKELSQIENLTVYTFLYPVLGADSLQKSRDIWCAKDRLVALNSWLIDAKSPPRLDCGSEVIDENIKLGRKLNINGTPTLFLADGSRQGGYLPADRLEAAMAEAEKNK